MKNTYSATYSVTRSVSSALPISYKKGKVGMSKAKLIEQIKARAKEIEANVVIAIFTSKAYCGDLLATFTCKITGKTIESAHYTKSVGFGYYVKSVVKG